MEDAREHDDQEEEEGDEEENDEDGENDEEEQHVEDKEKIEDDDEVEGEGDDAEENNVQATKAYTYSEQIQNALVGDFDSEFPENVNVVRIFTSSTFTGKLTMVELQLNAAIKPHVNKVFLTF